MFEKRVKIKKNEELGPGYFRMELDCPEIAAAGAPGQFVMVRVTEALSPLLRRPFSISDVDAGGSIALLIRVVGEGTRILSEKKAGESVDVLGPLGKGFDIGGLSGPALLVGGGIGAAPLIFLARRLAEKGVPGRVLLGGRTAADILCAPVFESLGMEAETATEDGSLGRKGLVTELLAQALTPGASAFTVFSCGPEGMLKAVAGMCRRSGAACQLSLEAAMACGMGACLGCATPRSGGGYLHVCTDGPVVSASLWPAG